MENLQKCFLPTTLRWTSLFEITRLIPLPLLYISACTHKHEKVAKIESLRIQICNRGRSSWFHLTSPILVDILNMHFLWEKDKTSIRVARRESINIFVKFSKTRSCDPLKHSFFNLSKCLQGISCVNTAYCVDVTYTAHTFTSKSSLFPYV